MFQRKTEKKHHWVITEWVVHTKEFKRPKKRYCKHCGKKQTISYLGGDMWKWKDVHE